MAPRKGEKRGKYKEKPIPTLENVICEICGKIYRKNLFEDHFIVKHLGYGISCIFCESRLVNKTVWKTHLKRQHGIKDGTGLPCAFEQITADSTISESELRLPTHRAFPNVAKCLVLSENDEFGVHVVAGRDIEKGELLIVSEPFGHCEYFDTQGRYCSECGRSPHMDFCTKTFKPSDKYEVVLATHMLAAAFKRLKLTHELFIEFCYNIIEKRTTSNKCVPPYSSYGEVLRLIRKSNGSASADAETVVQRLIKMEPELNCLVNEKDMRQKIKRIAELHISAIPINVFSCKSSNRDLADQYYLYDFISRINHSCDPNLDTFIRDDGVMECKTLKPIKNGEQLFVNYLGCSENLTTRQRKQQLKDSWSFECNCPLCR